MQTIETPHIETLETPREIISQDFKSVGELPIKGGWGYSIEDAVIIDKNDPLLLHEDNVDFLSIQKVFVEKRIYEELIVFRNRDDAFSGIKWKILKQELIRVDDRAYDFLTFEVTALPRKDWEFLKQEWEENSEAVSFDKGLHFEKHNALSVIYTTQYFFDITDFV